MRSYKLFPDRCFWTEAERLRYAKEVYFLHRHARKQCHWQVWGLADMQTLSVAARRDLAQQALFYMRNLVHDWNPEAEFPPLQWFQKYWRDVRKAVEHDERSTRF